MLHNVSWRRALSIKFIYAEKHNIKEALFCFWECSLSCSVSYSACEWSAKLKSPPNWLLHSNIVHVIKGRTSLSALRVSQLSCHAFSLCLQTEIQIPFPTVPNVCSSKTDVSLRGFLHRLSPSVRSCVAFNATQAKAKERAFI